MDSGTWLARKIMSRDTRGRSGCMLYVSVLKRNLSGPAALHVFLGWYETMRAVCSDIFVFI